MAQITGSIVRVHHAPRPVNPLERSRRRRPKVDTAVVLSLILGLMASGATAAGVYSLTGQKIHAALTVVAGVAALGLGALLGSSVWPTLGVGFARYLLALYARIGRSRNAQLMLTPYPDFVPGRLRQTWEAAAFAGGLAMVGGVNALLVLSAPSGTLPWLSLGLLGVCCFTTFLLVPHWAFARLGLRLSQQQRFVVTSVAESYSRFVRVSNGTILLAAIAYGATVLMGRAERFDAYVTVALTLGAVLALAVLVMASATAFFLRHDEEVVRRIAAEARRVGFIGVRAGRVASV